MGDNKNSDPQRIGSICGSKNHIESRTLRNVLIECLYQITDTSQTLSDANQSETVGYLTSARKSLMERIRLLDQELDE